MEGSLACGRSVPWNAYLILVPCVFIVDFRPLFKLLSKIVRGQSPYTLKLNQYAMTSAIPVDKHGFDRQPFQFCKNKANVIKFLRTGYNPSCNLLIFFFVVLDQTDEQ